MANDPPVQQATSIPSMDFRGTKFVNEDGTLSAPAQGFFDLLQKFLVKNIGEEGLVAASQTTGARLDIQNNFTTSVTNIDTYTCQFGTFLYDITTNKVYVTLNPGLTGKPVFTEIATV